MNILNLGKSKLKQEILKLYFNHPEKKYYLRELERILQKPVSYVRRSMMEMEKTGLFISELQGKEKYFRLNTKVAYYEDVKNIISKTIGIEGELRESLTKIDGIESAFIFGSYASGENDEYSDVDLMIIGHPDEDEIIAITSKLESKIDREINYHIFGHDEWQKKKKDRNSFIVSVDKKAKLFLIGN